MESFSVAFVEDGRRGHEFGPYEADSPLAAFIQYLQRGWIPLGADKERIATCWQVGDSTLTLDSSHSQIRDESGTVIAQRS